jgi:hypothetical protein
MACYQLTEYPEIYRQSYWGGYTPRKYDSNAQIIQNRNAFARKFQLVPRGNISHTIQEKHRYNADHQEMYEDKLGRFIQVYSQHSCREVIDDRMYRGQRIVNCEYLDSRWKRKTIPPFVPFKPTPSLYSLDQQSGYRIIETPKSKKILLQMVFQNIPEDVVKYIRTFGV